MDNKLTKQIQDWLNTLPQEQDIIQGAQLLLQLNRNRILYNNIIRNPTKLKDKLTYELQKHLTYRLDGLTLDAVKAMDKKVTAEVQQSIEQEPLKGHRPDHNQLPPDIQNLFIEAHNTMVTMRSIHEKLKLMNADKPCERYTFLKELIAAHDHYRSCLNRYDDFNPNNPTQQTSTDIEADTAKALSTYRGYISTNIKKLAKMPNGDKADRLREKIRLRYNECKFLNIQFSDETLTQLKELGIE